MGIFDGIINAISGGKDAAANDSINNALAQYSNIRVPTVEEQQLLLEELRQQGKLTPELEQAIMLQGSEMGNVSTDPRLKQAQLDSLLKLQEVANNDGMSAQDQSRLSQIQSQLRQQEQGSRQAIMQNMAQRGMSGSGFELAANLSNQQGSADRASAEGLEVKAQAEKRALEAIMNSGQLGGQIRNQDFTEKSAVAQAQDQINKFNTMNRQDVSNRNVNRNNEAQQTNLKEAQRVADTNVATRNTQQQYNKELLQNQFDNRLKLANGKSGVYNTQADYYRDQAKNRTGLTGTLISSGAALLASDENLKKNVKPADIDLDEFLKTLTPYSFDYKDKKHGSKSVGVMAQDLEKSDAGSSIVEETEDGKMVDTKKAAMLALAGLARLNDKINKMDK